MSEDGDALIRGIALRPLDNDLRRIYADWCDDNGQALRAEFIRLQLERLAAGRHGRDNGGCPHTSMTGGMITFCASCVRAASLRAKEDKILRTLVPHFIMGNHGSSEARWLWARPISRPGSAWTFERGFVEDVSCRTAGWMEWGPEAVAINPIRSVTLSDATPGSMLDGDGPPWGWYCASLSYMSHLNALRGDTARSDHYVYKPIWDEIRGEMRQDGYWKVFSDEGDAKRAHAAAALAWARKEAARIQG